MNKEEAALVFMGGMLVVGAATGSLLQGLWLSSRVLSPLFAGGILGSIVPALLLTFCLLLLLSLCFNERNIEREDLKNVAEIAAWTATSALIGVGIAAAANAMFPGVMLAMGSPALVGAVIGAMASLAGFFVIASVDGFIISPIIEHFSSKEKEGDPSLSCS